MRTRSTVLTLVIATTMTRVVAACDYVEKHAIEAAFAADIERSGGVTVDMRDAQGRAHEAWDAELNRLYRALLDRLKRETDRNALRTAQRAWLAFDRAEAQWHWSDAMHAQEGTAGPLNVVAASLDRLKRRVCDLRDALAWLDDSPGMTDGEE
jgi:uncharacterized protein YecT (DUF1311 family)